MAPAIEIVSWVASDAYLQDKSIVEGGVKFVLGVKGVLQVWSGLQIEKSRLFMVTVWDSIESHKALEADKEQYGKSLGLLGPTMAANPEVELYHAELDEDYPAAFNSPTVEFALITPTEEGATVETFKTLLAKLKVEAYKDTCTVLALSWGTIVEKPQTLLGVVGWKSIEAHHEEVKSGGFADVGKQFGAKGKIEFAHVHLAPGSK
ncbi:hypothetical protein HETIRDRAFT_148734 [Heterobasidion irregulare TC 32-1]|uniref:ABM domain-containing protein n=1 Tax=Heterobasidion irregulare (strain TC 32-1) TaxID=747525 RepID=W4JWT2_HETIT|nr:uncharacterized protein HETIRDRAFT_148734 [Heterobasidion irregulare TC 32-1]ETW78017.1 hypothetical protein HETIRDRAFT_148734 [Heterobasidion irregulare TC 32-1]